MKKPVMQREMFIAMAPKSESKGILSGFDEEMEIEDYEDRTPENLEIIANNLRGDIRSMDERYLELAQLVGESAFETPEEVIALMQSQMGQQQPPQSAAPAPTQQPGGIAALGGATTPQAPQGIMQGVAGPTDQGPMPGMEQMPQPGMEQPMQMAHGGIVHRANGSTQLGEIARDLRAFGSFSNPVPPAPYDPRLYGVPSVSARGAGPFIGPMPLGMSYPATPTPILSRESLDLIRSGALNAPSSLPPKISPALRASTVLSEGMRAAPGFMRELGRTVMGTPQGRTAAVIGTGLASTLPFLAGKEEPSTEPNYSEVPGVDASGRYVPVVRAPAQPPTPPYDYIDSSTVVPEEISGPGTIVSEKISGPGTTVPVPSVTPSAKEDKKIEEDTDRVKTYDERVQDRLSVFNRYLGSDPESRKAQALFLLAEAALNVAGAKGRSTAERLSTGLKGFPAGMAAIGAEAEKERRSIAASAISSVESDIQAAAKYNYQAALQNAKNAPNREKLIRNANFYMNRDGITQEMLQANPGLANKYLGMAQLIDDKTLTVDKSGDLVDQLGRPIPGFSRAAPTPTNGIGYLDPANPLVKVSQTSVTPATTEEKPGLITTKANNEQLILEISTAMDHLNKSVGLGPSFRAGVTNIFAPITGDVGLGLTDIQVQALRSRDRLLQDVLVKAKLRNPKAPVWEQKNIKDIIGNPSSIVNSWEEYLSVVNNIQRDLLNENAMIDARLNPGIPLKQIDRMPTGTKTDPVSYSPNVFVTLENVFKNRPNAKVWVAGKDESGKEIAPFQVEGKRFMEQLNAQRGQTQ